jgi:hypothetical protein
MGSAKDSPVMGGACYRGIGRFERAGEEVQFEVAVVLFGGRDGSGGRAVGRRR